MTVDIKTLEDSDYLLDTLIQCEDILDRLDIYVYKNWFSGEVVKGPIIRRHWVTVSLLYPLRKMPDPRAALRLMKHGILVDFKKVRRDSNAGGELEKEEEKEDEDKDKFWMIEITFPRRLLHNVTDDLEEYEDEIDSEDVEAAKDTGVDVEDAYTGGEEAFEEPAP